MGLHGRGGAAEPGRDAGQRQRRADPGGRRRTGRACEGRERKRYRRGRRPGHRHLRPAPRWAHAVCDRRHQPGCTDLPLEDHRQRRRPALHEQLLERTAVCGARPDLVDAGGRPRGRRVQPGGDVRRRLRSEPGQRAGIGRRYDGPGVLHRRPGHRRADPPLRQQQRAGGRGTGRRDDPQRRGGTDRAGHQRRRPDRPRVHRRHRGQRVPLPAVGHQPGELVWQADRTAVDRDGAEPQDPVPVRGGAAVGRRQPVRCDLPGHRRPGAPVQAGHGGHHRHAHRPRLRDGDVHQSADALYRHRLRQAGARRFDRFGSARWHLEGLGTAAATDREGDRGTDGVPEPGARPGLRRCVGHGFPGAGDALHTVFRQPDLRLCGPGRVDHAAAREQFGPGLHRRSLVAQLRAERTADPAA